MPFDRLRENGLIPLALSLNESGTGLRKGGLGEGTWIPVEAGICPDDFIVTTKNENSSAGLNTEILR